MAPLIGLSPRYGPVAFGRLLAETLCFAGLGDAYVLGGGDTAMESRPFPGNLLTSDRKRYDRTANVLAAAPELGLGSPTVGWVYAAQRAMSEIVRPDFAP